MNGEPTIKSVYCSLKEGSASEERSEPNDIVYTNQDGERAVNYIAIYVSLYKARLEIMYSTSIFKTVHTKLISFIYFSSKKLLT